VQQCCKALMQRHSKYILYVLRCSLRCKAANYAYAIYMQVFCICMYGHTHICTQVCLFVVDSHKFLYMKHCWTNKGHFWEWKSARLKREIYIYVEMSIKAILLWVFDCCAYSLTDFYTFLILGCQNIGKKIETVAYFNTLFSFTKYYCFILRTGIKLQGKVHRSSLSETFLWFYLTHCSFKW